MCFFLSFLSFIGVPFYESATLIPYCEMWTRVRTTTKYNHECILCSYLLIWILVACRTNNYFQDFAKSVIFFNAHCLSPNCFSLFYVRTWAHHNFLKFEYSFFCRFIVVFVVSYSAFAVIPLKKTKNHRISALFMNASMMTATIHKMTAIKLSNHFRSVAKAAKKKRTLIDYTNLYVQIIT